MLNLITLIAALSSTVCSCVLVYASAIGYIFFGEVRGLPSIAVSVSVSAVLIVLHRKEYDEEATG